MQLFPKLAHQTRSISLKNTTSSESSQLQKFDDANAVTPPGQPYRRPLKRLNTGKRSRP